MHPPREGLRPREGRALGPQRQGPHCRLRTRLERPQLPPRPQHRGPITRAFLDVLEALLWGFHNSRDGRCFPSYEAIAAKAECCRDTVCEALKALEWAGVLTWQNRITRALVRQRDLFGRWSNRWTVIRTSNAYVFRDPASKSDQRTGTPNQEIQDTSLAGDHPTAPVENAPQTALERALARFGAALAAKAGIEQGISG